MYHNTCTTVCGVRKTLLTTYPHSLLLLFKPYTSQLLRSLGEAGEIEPETASILTEYQIDDEEFPPEVLDCLPKLEENKKFSAPEVQ